MRCLLAAVVVLMFAGCAGHAIVTQPPINQQSRVAQTIASKPLPIPAYVVSLFVPYTDGHFVFLDKSYKQIATVKAMTSGQTEMDPQGDIYVLGFGGAIENAVMKYAPPYTEYSYIGGPDEGADMGFAVDPKTGDFTVNDVPWNDGEPRAALGLYLDGKRWPCKALWRFPTPLTQGSYDADGVPYMLYWDQNSQANLVSIPGGCDAKGREITEYSADLTGPVFFNAKNQLVQASSSSFNTAGAIVTYAHPNAKTGIMGKALFRTILNPIGGKTPFMVSFNSDGTEILAYYGNLLCIYKYPAGGDPIKVIHFAAGTGIAGVAAYPPLIP